MSHPAKPIIETPRLILREFKVDDAFDIYKLNADPEVIRYTGDSPFETVENARDFLNNYKDYENNGFGRWVVIKKDTYTFLGWCGLKLNEQNLIDLGFRFFRKEWNKGYATEAAKACLKYGFMELNIKEIIGRVAMKNTGSIKVLEKLAMEYWKNDSCKGIKNSLYYKISKAQYLKNTQNGI